MPGSGVAGPAENSGAGVDAGGAMGTGRAADDEDGGPDAGVVPSADSGAGVDGSVDIGGGVGRAIGGAAGRAVPGIGMFAAGKPISVRATGAGGRLAGAGPGVVGRGGAAPGRAGATAPGRIPGISDGRMLAAAGSEAAGGASAGA